GKVYDDTGVDRVALEYGGRFSPLSLPKGKDVPFFVEVPAKSATVIAVDAAGNRASRDVPLASSCIPRLKKPRPKSAGA
ncbi:hypothetical protein NL466_29040, partial [Klebsiella pneumoniae]|nr:hypothetical protein [Klebsiella pneumoniae]